MNNNIIIKFDPYDGKPYQINIVLNLISRVNLRHRRVEHRIYNYSKARFKLAVPMSGCFLSKCPQEFACRTCVNCECSYIKELL